MARPVARQVPGSKHLLPAQPRRSAPRTRGVVLAPLLGILAGACGGEDGEDHELPPDELLLDTSVRGLIDCSERQDTGYSSGNAFPITVVTVDGRPVERDTANAYYVMQQAAAADGVSIQIVSGFRTMSQQEYLYGCYVNCNCNNCNLAARPGYSNHQSGHALDLNTSSAGVLNWLNNHGAAFGFSRTVPSENWHWEWWGGGPGGGPCGTCTPHCEGSEIVDQSCGRGDCGAFGARCVDDAIGVRCASVFCPDVGTSQLCLDDSTLATCSDGAISTGDCGQFAAYCSTAGGPARCVSVFCVGSPDEVPTAHETCLPDGQRYRCDDRGGIAAEHCPSGQVCSAEPTVGCVTPGAQPGPAPGVPGVVDPGVGAGLDPGLPVELPGGAPKPGGVVPAGPLPPGGADRTPPRGAPTGLTRASKEVPVQGGCTCALPLPAGRSAAEPAWLLILPALLLYGRPRNRPLRARPRAQNRSRVAR